MVRVKSPPLHVSSIDRLRRCASVSRQVTMLPNRSPSASFRATKASSYRTMWPRGRFSRTPSPPANSTHRRSMSSSSSRPGAVMTRPSDDSYLRPQAFQVITRSNLLSLVRVVSQSMGVHRMQEGAVRALSVACDQYTLEHLHADDRQ